MTAVKFKYNHIHSGFGSLWDNSCLVFRPKEEAQLVQKKKKKKQPTEIVTENLALCLNVSSILPKQF